MALENAGAKLITKHITFNNALIHFSRMCDPQASCVVIELLALFLLLVGRRRGCRFLLYVGGVVAALGYYTIFPSRLVIFIWCTFMLGLLICPRTTKSTKLRTVAAASLLGFAMTILPLFIHCCFHPAKASVYTRMRIILLPEGLELQRDHFGLASNSGAYWLNVKRGLIAFNSDEIDSWGLYQTKFIGLVDPVTGVFMWVGLVSILWAAIRRRSCSEELLQVAAFLLMYFVMCFVINLAPAFSRAISMLPFVCYLAVRGIYSSVTLLLSRLHIRPSVQGALTRSSIAILCCVGVSLNLLAYHLFCSEQDHNVDVGSTLRYMIASSSKPAHRFFLVTDSTDPYVPLAHSPHDTDYFGYHLAQGQKYTEWFLKDGEDPMSLIEPLRRDHSFTIFMTMERWYRLSEKFAAVFPQYTVTPITRFRALVAVEVP